MSHTLNNSGVDEAKIIAMSLRQFGRLPPRMVAAPELLMGLELFWRAFMDLSTCRQGDGGSGPIMWTAVREWCNEHEISGSQRDDVFFHINQMDLVYLEFRAAKMKSTT